MTYRHVIKDITHWHEHVIHDRITPLVGYNTWRIGTSQLRMAETDTDRCPLDLTLAFPSRADYLKCRRVIGEVVKLEPEQPPV